MNHIKKFNSIADLNATKLESPVLVMVNDGTTSTTIACETTDPDQEIYFKGSTIESLKAATIDYLTFYCIAEGAVALTNYGDNAPNIQYKKNNGEWTTWNYSKLSLVPGDIIKMKGINPSGFSSSTSKYSKFVITGNIAARGNIMSLIDGKQNGTKTIPCDYCFYQMFMDCIYLNQAPELPATTLATGCYYYMFYHCSGIAQAPELPATTLAAGCYDSMFYNCFSLVKAPTLHALSLQLLCYSKMFYGCAKLNYVKCLATSLSWMTLGDWLSGVSSTGTFIKDSSTTYSTGASGIPSGWTIENI